MANIGIVGLGLIGGSFVKAFAKSRNGAESGVRVYGYDRDHKITALGLLNGDLQGELTPETLCEIDLLLLAVYPMAAAKYLEDHAQYLRSDCTVLDCCGTKKRICDAGFRIAEQYGFTFVGGHPMAGTHHSGYKYATADLFHGATMVLVPPRYDDIALLQRIKDWLSPAGFGRFSVMAPEEHDRIIAFTSQLAHVVSNAYVKSPIATNHKGCSAGSYKDLTRVAMLNPQMWTELFMENREPLIDEIQYIVDALCAYKTALEAGDALTLCDLLAEGSRRKMEIDGDKNL